VCKYYLTKVHKSQHWMCHFIDSLTNANNRHLSHCCSLYCCRDIKPQIYPGCELDLGGYMTSSVTWPHDSLYLISYRCFIDTDTNSKSGALTILELLTCTPKNLRGCIFSHIGAISIYAQKLRGHVTLTTPTFRKHLFRGHVGTITGSTSVDWSSCL